MEIRTWNCNLPLILKTTFSLDGFNLVPSVSRFLYGYVSLAHSKLTWWKVGGLVFDQTINLDWSAEWPCFMQHIISRGKGDVTPYLPLDLIQRHIGQTLSDRYPGPKFFNLMPSNIWNSQVAFNKAFANLTAVVVIIL